jgi:hypothetical protein
LAELGIPDAGRLVIQAAGWSGGQQGWQVPIHSI